MSEAWKEYRIEAERYRYKSLFGAIAQNVRDFMKLMGFRFHNEER